MKKMMAVLMLLLAPLAQADSFGVGLGAIYAASPYRETDATQLVIPVVNYESDTLYWHGIRGGYRFIKNYEHSFEFFIQAYAARFDPNDSDHPQLKRLNERKFSSLAGFAYRRNYDWGVLGAELAYDITGRSEGTVAEFSYRYPFMGKDARWLLAPQLGVAWLSDSYVDYYTEVSAPEAVRSGLALYDGHEAYSPFVALAGFYSLTSEWRLSLFARGELLDTGYSGSPMIDRRFVPSFFTAITYDF
jgi:MipA family protein